MIESFSVENYLSFRTKQTLSFEASVSKDFEEMFCVEVKPGIRLLKLGILYGANASGKTNLLKALDFLRSFALHPKSEKAESTGHIPFLFDDEYEHRPGVFSLVFYVDGIKYLYSLTIDKNIVYEEHLHYYPSSRPALFFGRRYDAKNEKSMIEFGGTLGFSASEKSLIEGLTIANTSVLAAFAKANIRKSLFNDVYGWFAKEFMKIIMPGTGLTGYTCNKVEKNSECKDAVLQILQKADLNIADIIFEQKKIKITSPAEVDALAPSLPDDLKKQIIKEGYIAARDFTFTHKTGLSEKPLPKELESSGTIRYFGLAGVLNRLLEPNTFLMVDEMENSLHTDLVSHFIKTFLMNAPTSQLLFTTHNINLLSEDYMRRDVVWFAEKNDLGETALYSLIDFKLHKNLSPLNAYKAGKLGAKPHTYSVILQLLDAKNKTEIIS